MNRFRCNANLRPLVAAAVHQGWDVAHTGKAHLRFRPPDRSRPLVIVSHTASDHRAYERMVHDLQHSGLRWPA